MVDWYVGEIIAFSSDSRFIIEDLGFTVIRELTREDSDTVRFYVIGPESAHSKLDPYWSTWIWVLDSVDEEKLVLTLAHSVEQSTDDILPRGQEY